MPTDRDVTFRDVLAARGDSEKQTDLSLRLLIRDVAGTSGVGFLRGTPNLSRLVREMGFGILPLSASIDGGPEIDVQVVCGAPLKQVQRLALLGDQKAFVFWGAETEGRLVLHHHDAKPEHLGGLDHRGLRTALERLLGGSCTFRMRPRGFIDALQAQAAGEPVVTWMTAG